MPDIPYFASPWAVQLQQVHCITDLPQLSTKLFGRHTGKAAGFTGSITNSSCSLISQFLSHLFSKRWFARLQSNILQVCLLFYMGHKLSKCNRKIWKKHQLALNVPGRQGEGGEVFSFPNWEGMYKNLQIT